LTDLRKISSFPLVRPLTVALSEQIKVPYPRGATFHSFDSVEGEVEAPEEFRNQMIEGLSAIARRQDLLSYRDIAQALLRLADKFRDEHDMWD
jgi:hypothetical protein